MKLSNGGDVWEEAGLDGAMLCMSLRNLSGNSSWSLRMLYSGTGIHSLRAPSDLQKELELSVKNRRF